MVFFAVFWPFLHETGKWPKNKIFKNGPKTHCIEWGPIFFNGDPILSEMGTHRNKDFLFEKSVSSFGAQCFHK